MIRPNNEEDIFIVHPHYANYVWIYHYERVPRVVSWSEIVKHYA